MVQPRTEGAAERPAATSVAEDFVAACVTNLASQLNAGASAYYRARWGIGMPEWRAIMAIGSHRHLIARDIAALGGLDTAAVSRALRNLAENGVVSLKPSGRRGAAAVVVLTAKGLDLYRELRAAGQARQDRLLADFTAAEVAELWRLLGRLAERIPAMNREDRKTASS